MHDVGPKPEQTARQACDVQRRSRSRRDRQPAACNSSTAEGQDTARQRKYLDGDARPEQTRDERPVLTEQDVWLDAFERGQETREHQLRAGQARAMRYEGDSNAGFAAPPQI